MCICRILSIHKFNIIDLTEMEVIFNLIFSGLQWIKMFQFLVNQCLLTLMDFFTLLKMVIKSQDS